MSPPGERLLLRIFCFWILGVTIGINGNRHSLETFLKAHPGISEFFKLLHTSPYLRVSLRWKQGTLFVPKNEAINAFRASGKIITNTTLIYHFCNFAMPLQELEKEFFISSDTAGNSPIWITKTDHGIYLNDAKYITGNFQVAIEDHDGHSTPATYVHVIDRVLEPAVPAGNPDEHPYLQNPDAWKYIEHMASYTISGRRVATRFAAQVQQNRSLVDDLYKKPGFRTYFVPVNEALMRINDANKVIDSKVIHGHVIPSAGLFLRTLQPREHFETYTTPTFLGKSAKGSSFTTVITFDKILTKNGTEIWLVNSDNREGDEKHRKGVVQAEIIQKNIPVKNGVVHLISKPLVVIDMNVYQTFEWYATKQNITSVGRFFELVGKLSHTNASWGHDEVNRVKRMATEIRQLLEGGTSLTKDGISLFIPTNEAIELWNDKLLQKPTRMSSEDMIRLGDLVRTHIVKEVISAQDMIEHSKMRKIPFQVQSAYSGRKLLFSSFIKDGYPIIHVEGGGVNATVIQKDFGATNGFIHIIDRVLGLPDQTIIEKLRSHPMLQSTFHLWRKSGMSERLNHTNYPLTFFAPSEIAWIHLRKLSDSAYHNFFHSNSASILELLRDIFFRHIVEERGLTIEHLVQLSQQNLNLNNTGNMTILRYPIQTLGGDLDYISVNSSKTYLTKNPTRREFIPSTSTASTTTIGGTSTTTTTTGPVTFQQDQTKNGHEHGEENHYYVYWNRMWAHVIRTNVKCTNGIIQIVDEVFMDSVEVTVASGRVIGSTSSLILLALILPFHFIPI